MISQRLLCFNKFFKYFYFQNLTRFSSARRIAESDPKNHLIDHVGSFYRIPDSEFSTCFESQIKPDFTRLLKAFDDKSIIIRNQAIEVINYIRSSDLTKPVIRYLFYGRDGSGKTVQMAQVSHYAHKQNDWLLLHFSNAFNFLHISPELNTNSIDENLFDTPTLSGMWLKSFLNINSQFLDKYRPKTLKRIEWNQKEHLEPGVLWTDIINFSISRPKYTSDCIGILLREAREHAQLKEFKVLGVIRGVNCLFQLSSRADISMKYIPAERISVLKYWRRFLRNDWSNGAIICSVNTDMVYRVNERESHYPKYLLGSQGLKEMDPFVPISVGPYTDQEVTNYLNFLEDNKWLVIPEAKDPYGIGRKEIAFLSDNQPEELFNVTKEW